MYLCKRNTPAFFFFFPERLKWHSERNFRETLYWFLVWYCLEHYFNFVQQILRPVLLPELVEYQLITSFLRENGVLICCLSWGFLSFLWKRVCAGQTQDMPVVSLTWRIIPSLHHLSNARWVAITYDRYWNKCSSGKYTAFIQYVLFLVC